MEKYIGIGFFERYALVTVAVAKWHTVSYSHSIKTWMSFQQGQNLLKRLIRWW